MITFVGASRGFGVPILLMAIFLEARAVTLYVSRIRKHTRSTHVLLVLAPVLCPLRHVIKSSRKLFASDPLNDLLAAVTDNFNWLDWRVRNGFGWHRSSLLRSPYTANDMPERSKVFWRVPGGDVTETSEKPDGNFAQNFL